MPDVSLIVAYGTVVNVAGDVRIDGKYCRDGFNVEARKMGGRGAYLLDFDTDPPSPGPALPRPPVVLATARGTTGSDDHPCYAQTGASRATTLSFTSSRPQATPFTFSLD